MFISIIIRTKNEAKYLGQVLEMIKRQTFQDFEIIVVDDHSTDKTVEIAKHYGCKIIMVEKGKFTYPYACNIGVRNSAGQYIVFLSGHSIPIDNNWLDNGLKNFENKKVAGVYGIPLALPDANLLERLSYAFYGNIFYGKRIAIDKIKNVKMGTLGFTNAIIRRDLWEQYKINESFAGGGEDGDWARHWVKKGLVLIHDPKFKVYHSHNLGLIDLIRQFFGWKKMRKEKEFVAQKKNM